MQKVKQAGAGKADRLGKSIQKLLQGNVISETERLVDTVMREQIRENPQNTLPVGCAPSHIIAIRTCGHRALEMWLSKERRAVSIAHTPGFEVVLQMFKRM